MSGHRSQAVYDESSSLVVGFSVIPQTDPSSQSANNAGSVFIETLTKSPCETLAEGDVVDI